MRNNRGFTLVELIVAMGMFIVIMMIASNAFEHIIATSGQQVKSAESNIEGIVGLEMVRYEIEHAGYGLPWGFQNYSGAIKFKIGSQEVNAGNEMAKGLDSSAFNAVRTRNIQAFTAGTSTKEVNNSSVTNVNGGPDYLVIRSTAAALSKTARKWTYVNYSSSDKSYLKMWNNPSDDFAPYDRIITLLSSFTATGREDKILLMDGDSFEVTLTANLSLPPGSNFKPADASQTVAAYGVRESESSDFGTPMLRMPYNRTDFYVSRPATNVPQQCNLETGILYKAVASHTTGDLNSVYPLLDCVGDMQVEFEYDPDDDGNISYRQADNFSNVLSATDIRDNLKKVRVYILAHEGKKDRSYTYPGDSIQVGDRARSITSGRTLSAADMTSLFGADWRNYRWKIYTIVTRPKNLVQ